MKRFVALLLMCCLLVSALSVSAFAAGSILGVAWDSSCNPSTFSVPNGSSRLYFSFAPVRRLNGFGSITLRTGLSYFDDVSYPASSVYELPAGSTFTYSFVLSVSGVNGFGSEKIPAVAGFRYPNTDGTYQGESTFSSTYNTIQSGKLIYRYSGSIVIDKDFYSYVNIRGYIESSYLSGKSITLTLESCSFRVTSLGQSDNVESSTNQVINNINNTIINNNTEVIAQITNVIGVLNNLFQNTVQINTYLDSLVGEINAMGSDLDSVLSYLQQVVSTLDYLPRIYSKLDSIGLSSETIQALIDGISASISPAVTDLSQVEEYLSNTLNQVSHIAEVVDAISAKLDISNGWFEQLAGHLVKIQTDVGFCSTYLQGLYNTLSMMDTDIIEMRKCLEESNDTLISILEEVKSISASVGSDLYAKVKDILLQLSGAGTDLHLLLTMFRNCVGSIRGTAENTEKIVDALSKFSDDLTSILNENTETNQHLKEIEDLLKDLEINVSKTTNNVLTSDDQKGLGALVSKLISHLLSVVDFVTDLFGSIFTSVPSTISAYNDCNSFWGDQKTYIYTPHQISGYTGQGGASYENSNTAVQRLFAEAEKYLGYPYVFGGSSPETSFDCSGFVCYALNHSGVYSIGRTTAQGLYDACTPVDRLNAQPGDLVFFTGTYNCADPVSHVGIYAGDGKMLHCGDPIQYTSIDTAYWQSHFYSFGRLSYNTGSDS